MEKVFGFEFVRNGGFESGVNPLAFCSVKKVGRPQNGVTRENFVGYNKVIDCSSMVQGLEIQKTKAFIIRLHP